MVNSESQKVFPKIAVFILCRFAVKTVKINGGRGLNYGSVGPSHHFRPIVAKFVSFLFCYKSVAK
jgi:hypothetical protein